MRFDASDYGPEVASLLALDGNGWRLMPLAAGSCSSPEAARRLKSLDALKLFPGARAPEAALSGLWLYFSCLDESHLLSQEIDTAEGSFWHGIMHRQEPDATNAAYWFRKVGMHAVFKPLREAADGLGFRGPAEWDPFAFIEFCTQAGRRGSADERLALEVQRAEWQLLFDWSARGAPPG